VATFAYNAAQGNPLQVHDPVRELTLVYVHDVAQAMLTLITAPPSKGKVEYREVSPVTRATLQKLATTFAAFRQSRLDATAPIVATAFDRKLYATYLSHLNPDALSYNLTAKSDARGVLAEFFKSETSGQLFISRTRPGAVRGNHYHRTKTEKFFVVEGEGLIRIRPVADRGKAFQYRVSGTDLRVVDIPPDHTHSIENVGSGELVVLFWASEIFDPNDPDTLPLEV
jgi:UDP-2-acetamido-2,6-beta-L-arabino-hexul-4-ose reductase